MANSSSANGPLLRGKKPTDKEIEEAAPKGVDVGKWRDCVHDVMGKQGSDIDPYNAYAVCSASLTGTTHHKSKDEEGGPGSTRWGKKTAGTGKHSKGVHAKGAHTGTHHKKHKQSEQAIKFVEKTFGSLREAKTDANGNKRFKVTIIRQGLGNLRDKNYYTQQAIQSGAATYEGKKAYYDHPTATQEEEQPNRSVKDVLGHYENVKPEQAKDGLWELNGDLVPIPGDSRKEATEMLQHAVQYRKKYPDQNFVGISINGSGEGKMYDYEDFVKEYKPSLQEMEKLEEVKGEPINAITKLTDAVSADIVTEPGAGGKVMALQESMKKERESIMLKAMRKLLDGIAKKDEKLVETAAKELAREDGAPAVKDMLNSEAEKKEMQAVKDMLQAMDEVEKKEDESEDEHKMRAMQAAYEALKKMEKKKEDEDESEDEDEGKKEDKDGKDGKDGAKDDDGDDDDGQKEGKKEDGDGDDGDDKDHPDAAKDKALFKKLMKKQSELEGRMEKMEKEKEAAEAESKAAHEEAAKLKTEKVIKDKVEMIDRKLAESGYPRAITKNWKPALDKCRTEKEVDELLKTLKETAAKVIEESFVNYSPLGFIEAQAAREDIKTNDELFK